MSALNGAGVREAVSEILAGDYAHDFDPIYEVTVRAARNTLPAQPINEVRNFTGHLANALVEADPAEVDLELARAMRHLRLATYDALVITLLEREDYVQHCLRQVERRSNGSAGPFKQRVQLIAEKRRGLPRIEPKTQSDMETIRDDVDRTTAANEMIEQVITTTNELARDLEQKFGLDMDKTFEVAEALPKDHRMRMVRNVWTYAGILFLLLGILEIVALRSWQMLIAVAGVCFCGGLLGTYIALTEPETAPKERS